MAALDHAFLDAHDQTFQNVAMAPTRPTPTVVRAALARANTNFVYNVKRMIPQLFQTSIRSQHQRHVLPCRLMESSPAREALKFAAMAATSQCQLSAHLNLVELNYTVSIFSGTALVPFPSFS